MVDEVVYSLEKMKLTLDEEEVIVILEEGDSKYVEKGMGFGRWSLDCGSGFQLVPVQVQFRV